MPRKNELDRKHISVSKSYFDKLKAQAKREGVSKAFIIDRDVAKFFNAEPPKPRKGWRTN